MARKIVAALVGAGLAVLTVPAFAGTLTEGVYYGTGNSSTNYNWTVATGGGVELGLQALIRYPGGGPEQEYEDTTTSSNNASGIYWVPDGATTYPGKTGSVWGYAFSVYVPTGNSLNDYTFSITVTDANNPSDTTAFTPYGALNPSSCATAPTSACGPTDDATTAINGAGFQNSEAISYALVGLPGSNWYAPGSYTIALTATPTGGGQAITDTITVNTPEPVSMSILGVGLVGMAAARRRAKKARC